MSIFFIGVMITSFIFIGMKYEGLGLVRMENRGVLDSNELELVGEIKANTDFMGNVCVEGTIKNLSEETMKGFRIKFDIYDKSQTKIGVAQTEILMIASMNKLKFKAIGVSPNGVAKIFRLSDIAK